MVTNIPSALSVNNDAGLWSPLLFLLSFNDWRVMVYYRIDITVLPLNPLLFTILSMYFQAKKIYTDILFFNLGFFI